MGNYYLLGTKIKIDYDKIRKELNKRNEYHDHDLDEELLNIYLFLKMYAKTITIDDFVISPEDFIDIFYFGKNKDKNKIDFYDVNENINDNKIKIDFYTSFDGTKEVFENNSNSYNQDHEELICLMYRYSFIICNDYLFIKMSNIDIYDYKYGKRFYDLDQNAFDNWIKELYKYDRLFPNSEQDQMKLTLYCGDC